jgi:hypothetical protein
MKFFESRNNILHKSTMFSKITQITSIKFKGNNWQNLKADYKESRFNDNLIGFGLQMQKIFKIVNKKNDKLVGTYMIKLKVSILIVFTQ